MSTFPDSFLTTTSTSLEFYAPATLHWLLIPLNYFPLTDSRVFLAGYSYSLELSPLISYCFSWLSYFLSDYSLNTICSWKLSRIPRGGNLLHRGQEICPYILKCPHQSTYPTLWALLVYHLVETVSFKGAETMYVLLTVISLVLSLAQNKHSTNTF